METTAWLDPSVQYLPVRILMRDTKATGGEERQVRTYQVTQYMPVMGVDKKQYHFPKQGVFRSPIVLSRLTSVEVAINGTVDEGAFRPQFPDLTEVRRFVRHFFAFCGEVLDE
jgi:hypothetical protein